MRYERLAAGEDEQGARAERKLTHVAAVAVQYGLDNRLLVSTPPDAGHVLEDSTRLRRLHHQRDGELRLVEMPPVLAAVDEDVHRACSERVRKAMEPGLPQHRADEVLERLPQVESPERRVLADPIVRNRTHEGPFLSRGHVPGRYVGSGLGEIDAVCVPAEPGVPDTPVRLLGQDFEGLGPDEARQHAQPGLEKAFPGSPQESGAVGRIEVFDWTPFKIHHASGAEQELLVHVVPSRNGLQAMVAGQRHAVTHYAYLTRSLRAG